MKGSYFIYTFGCAMNEYDSERIASALEKRGLIPAESASTADFIMFNTCSVREKPQIKIASYLGRVRIYKKSKPNIIVGIAGCVAQQEGEKLLKCHSDVNFIVGTEALARIDDILERAVSGERFTDTSFSEGGFSIDGFSRKQSVTASVTIMKGCENFCTYCIVPYVRGKERSRTSDEVCDEVKRLVDLGVKEVTLLGQNVNSYGRGLAEDIDFSGLLRKVDTIEGIKRIRFITSHPKDFSEKLVHTAADCEKVCNYFHLPLQSGSDNILSAMNRGYTFKEYAAKIEYARKILTKSGFSSDFIVGFPNETEEDFKQTLSAINSIGYDHIFAFNYSPRPGTAAEKLGDTVPHEVKSERLTSLFDTHNAVCDEKLPHSIGEITEVLVTGRSKMNIEQFTGCNPLNRNINFISGREIATGEIVQVEITQAKRNSLYGHEVK